jgi:DNA-binding response OmpR family regulator
MTSLPQKKVILIVDDTPEILDLIKIGLTPEHEVKAAVSGEVALKIAQEHPLDLILLDVMMPEMDGYEVCRRLREIPSVAEVPIIFVTAMSDMEDEIKGLALGAVDYLTKPISLPILQARVQAHLALRQARQELQLKKQLLENERQLVEEIVVRMRTDHQFDARHLRTLVSPVEATSGDLTLSAFRPDGSQHLLVGDFTGHGLPAAIGAPLVSYLFYSMTLKDCPVSEIFTSINQVLHRQLPTQIFMAAAFIEITPSRDRLTLWNASLPDCLLVRSDGQISHHASSQLALGIIPDLTPEAGEQLLLSSDDRFFVLTDGLIEATNAQQEMFGYPRMEPLLVECALHDHPLETVLERVNDFRGTGAQLDDFTLVELRP